MDRKPTIIEMILSMTLILILIFAIASFFLGIEVGTERTEARFEKEMQVLYAENNIGEYSEQDFASFYHTALLPYRHFEKSWFKLLASLPDMDHEQSMRALALMIKETNEQHTQLELAVFAEQATKLCLSHANYKLGLSEFSQGLEQIQQAATSSTSGADLYIAMKKNSMVQEAISTVLLAQKLFYSAMLHWSESNSTKLITVYERTAITIQQWNELTLASKNEYIATYLYNENKLHPFMPQDMSAVIDRTLTYKNYSLTAVSSINELIKQLITSNAVHDGDFASMKDRYKLESLPQLSLFIEP